MSPARWHRYLGTAVLVAMLRFPYRSASPSDACVPAGPEGAGTMIALPVGAQGEHRRDAWDTRSVVERHTRRCISVGTHDGGRPAGERVRTPCSGVSSLGSKSCTRSNGYRQWELWSHFGLHRGAWGVD